MLGYLVPPPPPKKKTHKKKVFLGGFISFYSKCVYKYSLQSVTQTEYPIIMSSIAHWLRIFIIVIGYLDS